MALDPTNFDNELMELRRRLGFHGEPATASGLTDDQLPDLQPNNQSSRMAAIPTASTANPAYMPGEGENGGEEESNGPGFFGTLADVGKGMAAGAYDAVAETVNLASDGANLFMDEGDKFSPIMNNADIELETGWGKAAKGITQFVVGFIGAGKFLKAAKVLQGAGKAVTVGRGLTEGAIADFTVFDAHEERLSNLIESNPVLANPITDYLSAREDDSAIEGRFKNAIEGMCLGVVGEALITMVKGVKAARGAKTVAEAEETVIRTADELQGIAARTGQTSEELADSVDSILGGKPTMAGEGGHSPSSITATIHDAGEGGEHAAIVDTLNSADAVDLTIRGDSAALDDVAKAVTGETDTISHNTLPHPDTPVSELPGSCAPLSFEEMRQITKEALDKGKATPEEILKYDFLIGNERRVRFATPEECALHGELKAKVKLETLKGKGVETHKMVAERSEEYIRSNDLGRLLNDAANIGEVAEALTMKIQAFDDTVKNLGSEVLALEREMLLHGQTPEKLARLQEFTDAIQTLSIASSDGVTAAARVVSGRRAGVNYLSPEVMTTILKMPGMDSNKLLKITADVQKSSLRRAGGAVLNVVINGLLSGPKSHLSNIGSNALKTVMMPAEQMLGGVWSGLKGGSAQQISQGMHTYVGLTKYAGESFKMAYAAFKSGEGILDAATKFTDSGRGYLNTYGKIKDHLLQFYTAKKGGMAELNTWDEIQANFWAFLGHTINFPTRLLGGADEFFKQLNYRANMYSKLTEEGLLKHGRDAGNELGKFVEDGMQAAFDAQGRGLDKGALRLAQESTWTQPLRDDAYLGGGLGQHMSDLVHKWPPLQLVAPFIKTPTNIIRDFAAHTPGMAHISKRYKDAIKAGGEQAAMAHGRIATGSMIWLTAIGLAYSGKMTGNLPKDPATRQAWQDAGIEPYSFKIGDKYISYARLDPFAAVFGIAADVSEYTRNWSEVSKGNWASGAILALGQNVLSKTYLSGITGLMAALSDDSVDSKAMQRYMQQAATMFIPYSAGLRFTRQMMDDPMREVRSVFDSMLNAIPEGSPLLPVKYSWITGKPVSMNVWYGQDSGDMVANEMARLGDNMHIGAPDRTLKNAALDGNQYSRLCQLQGTIRINGLTQHQQLERLMKSTSYDMGRKRIPDMPGDYEDPRSIMVKQIITQYRAAARDDLLREDAELRKAVNNELNLRMAARRGELPPASGNGDGGFFGIQELLTRQ